MNKIEFKQHPLLNILWLMYVEEQTIGTLNKGDGQVRIFGPIVLSASQLHQITEQSNIDYCIQFDKSEQ